MASQSPLINVYIPRLEDEIEKAWQNWQQISETNMRDAFEAGFKAARTISPGALT